MTLALGGKSGRRKALLGGAGLAVLAVAGWLALFDVGTTRSTASSTVAVPSSNGHYAPGTATSGWQPSTGAAVDSWQLVNEGACVTDTTYISRNESTLPSASFQVSTESLPAGSTITAIDVHLCYAANAAGNKTLAPILRVNGTEYLGEAFTYSSPTQNPTTRDPQRFDVNLASPSDSTIEVGVRRSGGAIRVYAVWAVLHYTTPSPPLLPDLTVAKNAVQGGQPVATISADEDFRWQWTIENQGEAVAAFAAGHVVLRDELPGGMGYSDVHSTSAALTCGVEGGVLTCTANAGLSIPAAGTVTVSLLATPSSPGTYTNSPAGCTVDYLAGNSAGNVAESDESNNTCAEAVSVEVVALPPPPVVLPTVRKEVHVDAVVGGKARWTITIDQPDEYAAPQTVVITDAHADIELVGPPGTCSLEAGVITCEVSEIDLSVTVARVINAAALESGTLCGGGLIANHLLSAEVAGGAPLVITAGAEPLTVAVRDTSYCLAPSVVKRLADGTQDETSDPAGVRWEIAISNPEGGLDGVVVHVRDKDAVFIDSRTSPEGQFASWCKTSEGPAEVTCVLPAAATVVLTVVPGLALELVCEARVFSNSAEYRVGDSPEWVGARGPDIVLTGSANECPREITVIKRLANVPDGRDIDPAADLPTLEVPDGQLLSGPEEFAPREWAWTYLVPPHYGGEIAEIVPSGWERVPCEAPAGDAYATFCNQPLASITVRKAYNPNGGPDATDDDVPLSIMLEGHGAFLPAGTTSNNATTYTPKEVSAGRFTVVETLSAGWHPKSVVLAGSGCTEVVPGDLFEAVQHLLTRAVHMLHLEAAVTFDVSPGANCEVTFTNERLVATVIVEKVYIGADGDQPALSIEVDGLDSPGTWATEGAPITQWTRMVSVAAAGSAIAVEETLPAGWANVAATVGACEGIDSSGPPREGATAAALAEDVRPGDVVVFCFVNAAVGRVQLFKLDGVSASGVQTWNFVSDAPGVSGFLQTPAGDGVTQAQFVTELVPVGRYTIAELEGRGACQPGAFASEFQTRAAARIGEPPADASMDAVVGTSPITFDVAKGQTTYIRFDNEGCGTVLGTGTIVVWKFADYDGDGVRDPGEPPVADWPFTISGPDGTFEVRTDVEGKHVFTVATGGTYTVSEQAADGWRIVGSRQANGFLPGGVAPVTAGLGEHREVAFFNQPRVDLRVTKSEVSTAFPAGRPGAGWEFTLTGCGIEDRTGATGPDGLVVFSDLPPATGCSYVVTETERDGWFALFSSRSAAPTGPGEVVTLAFRNTRLEGCDNCGAPLPGSQPDAPVASPPSPTASPPPATAQPDTAGPGAMPSAPVTTAVAGERTPGPGPAPLPPATGFGPPRQGSAFLLLFAGSFAVATGLMFLRMGRRR